MTDREERVVEHRPALENQLCKKIIIFGRFANPASAEPLVKTTDGSPGVAADSQTCANAHPVRLVPRPTGILEALAVPAAGQKSPTKRAEPLGVDPGRGIEVTGQNEPRDCPSFWVRL